MREGVSRTLLVTTGVCVLCSVLVSSAAVLLADRQDENRALFVQRRVLQVAGLDTDGMAAADVHRAFDEGVRSQEVTLSDGQRRQVHLVDGAPSGRAIVLPIEGQGLWSTVRGLLALSADDGNTIVGITFHEHGETPGLGGEVDSPRWQARWRGRLAFDPEGRPAIEVVKGAAGTPAQDPHRVDAIAGATITSLGVSDGVRRGLGAEGFGPYLAELREGTGRP